VTYPELSSHLLLFTKIGIVYLLTQDSSEFKETWEVLAMREWVAKQILEEHNTILPNFVHRIIVQRAPVFNQEVDKVMIID
jgi:hypothetical protein